MHFPRLDVGQIKIKPIEKGGSDRNFYRIRCSEEQSLILVKYNLEREENRHYVPIAKFLDAHGIRVPKIFTIRPKASFGSKIWVIPIYIVITAKAGWCAVHFTNRLSIKL
jgi:hypothetical protein